MGGARQVNGWSFGAASSPDGLDCREAVPLHVGADPIRGGLEKRDGGRIASRDAPRIERAVDDFEGRTSLGMNDKDQGR